MVLIPITRLWPVRLGCRTLLRSLLSFYRVGRNLPALLSALLAFLLTTSRLLRPTFGSLRLWGCRCLGLRACALDNGLHLLSLSHVDNMLKAMLPYELSKLWIFVSFIRVEPLLAGFDVDSIIIPDQHGLNLLPLAHHLDFFPLALLLAVERV